MNPFEFGTVLVEGAIYEANRNVKDKKVYYYIGSRTYRASRRISATFQKGLNRNDDSK